MKTDRNESSFGSAGTGHQTVDGAKGGEVSGVKSLASKTYRL
jgi:hypothetical protein